jgi:hypothetical protein
MQAITGSRVFVVDCSQGGEAGACIIDIEYGQEQR